jgi:membrane-associated phospholipid phosphatase
MRRWPVGLALWLVVLAAVEVVAFVVVARFFVRTAHGQLLDTVALTGNSIGRVRIGQLVTTILDTLSAVSLLIATATVGFIALIRRRIAVAFGAILLIAGANLTTQVFKELIIRPDLGIDVERAAAGNSLPSGHTTLAGSVAVAFMLVLPWGTRGIGGLLGALFAAAAGVATLSAGWHRPSDAVAAMLVVGGWACAAGLFILVAQRRHGDVDYGPPNRFAVVALAVTGLALLVGATIAMELTNQVLATPAHDLSRRRLFAAYAGGAMGIAGTTALVFASVLATVHRVVPRTVDATLVSAADE